MISTAIKLGRMVTYLEGLLPINSLKAQSKVWDTFDNWKFFKNDEKSFLFHLKHSFRSQDI